MALHLCRGTFTGELSPGVAKTFHQGVDVLDDSVKEEAALIKKFGAYFSEVVSTHIHPAPTGAEVAATKQAVKAKVKAAKAVEVTPTPAEPAHAAMTSFHPTTDETRNS